MNGMFTIFAILALLLGRTGPKGPQFAFEGKSGGTGMILVQDEKHPIKLPAVGAKFTYESTLKLEDGTEDKIETTWEVSKVEGEKCTVALESGSVLVWSYQDGYYVWGNEDNSAMSKLFKVGAKVGDSWDPTKDQTGNFSVTYLADEEVKVGAGTYKNCMKVEMTKKNNAMKIVQWFSPEVGLVKGQKVIADQVLQTYELKKYEAGK